jgi:TatD DNase family protein
LADTLIWDTHAHLTDPGLEKTLNKVLDDTRDTGVHGIINIAVDRETSRKALLQANQAPDRMRVTVGLHPHKADRFDFDTIPDLKSLAGEDPVVAIGEIGLDYHYFRSEKTCQLKAFQSQMEMASELDRPVVIHSRDAEVEVADILEEMRDGLTGGVLHCYTGRKEEAGRVLDLGFYISFTGIVTFGDTGMDELVRFVPLERILLETDSPYLAPVPYRGKINSPSYLPIIAEKLAALKEVDYEELISETSNNASLLFGL